MTRPIDATVLTEQIQKLCYDEYMANWLRVLIDNQPTIKVEPIEVTRPTKHGYWIRTGRTNVYGGIELVCSECDDHVMVQHVEDELYCRHCGARLYGARYEE